ncbi:nuclear transport factor 2 family protein [Williamsia serinedens]|uniref:SnoaL-like domain-containing protein n=1 Tax=Williamsia serinedens TaxID=391736 RepID=A0ABT1H168_9NOCA|nr:nuclear transport factor 2 family protein [Williamsia serinedens]MCP2160986.1 SnoaL-like domain-containing protein [Williamsia serinedens]
MSDDATPAAMIADVMQRNVVEVFTTTDDAVRRGLVEELYHPDAAFHDEDGTVTGHDAIDAKIRSLQQDTPGLVFTVTVPPSSVRDLGRISWALGPADGPTVVSGMDIGHVRDGRIAELYTFLDPR